MFVLVCRLSTVLFGNKGNERGVEGFQDHFCTPGILNHIQNILFDNMPTRFKKIHIETIWPWCFSILHIFENLVDLLFLNWSIEVKIVLSGHQFGDKPCDSLDGLVPV